MYIRNSILAGELLELLDKVSGSIRIIDLENFLHSSPKKINSAIARLLSEGLIKIIKDDERVALTLTEKAKLPKKKHHEQGQLELFAAAKQAG